MSQNATSVEASLESLVARVADEFLDRQRRGDRPAAAEYVSRYPEAAGLLGEVLAALEIAGLSEAGTAAGDAGVPLEGTLGDYRLMREVGRGGMGIVYEAEQISLNRRVALKVLPFAATLDPKQLQRFKNEAKAAGSLYHEHIVHVYGVGCERGVHYYAMQFVEGQTLAAVIEGIRGRTASKGTVEVDAASQNPAAGSGSRHPDGGRQTPPTEEIAALSTQTARRDKSHYRHIAELVAQAADALEHAHGLGIIHRDVKPANLLVDVAGKVYVSDFGLARFGADAGLTMSGDVIGTLRYMAPEQALAKHGLVDHRVDVYALGATLYELLTGRPAVDAAERAEVLRRIAFDEPTSPRKLERSIPAELETIALKCLAKSPADRYATAGELAEDLRRWLSDQTIRAKPPSLIQRVRRWGRRHRALAWSAAATLLLALVMLAGSFGYVASDRAARRGEAARATGQALDESDEHQRRGNYREALSAARRAERLAAGDAAGAALREQAERRRADLELVTRLDEARLDGTAVKDDHFDMDRSVLRYEEELRAAGIDLDRPTEEVVDRIRATSVAVEIAAVLDDWPVRGTAARMRLPDVARRVDPDEWRCRLRDARATGDVKTLKELAGAADVSRQPARSLAALGSALFRAGEAAAVIRLLGQAQVAYAGDFWINHELGWAYRYSNPPRLAEAVRYWSVAVAIRPDSPGARLNLGGALDAVGRADESVATLREAVRLKPDYVNAYGMLAEVLAKSRRTDDPAPGDDGRLRARLRRSQQLDGYLRANRWDKIAAVAAELAKDALGEDNSDRAFAIATLARLADAADKAHHWELALTLTRHAVAARERQLGPDHPDTIAVTHWLVGRCRAVKRYEEAEALSRDLVRRTTRVLGPTAPDTLTALRHTADVLSLLGRHADAIAMTERQLTTEREKYGPDASETIGTLQVMVWAYYRAGRYEDAARAAREHLALLRTQEGQKSGGAGRGLAILGTILLAQSRYAEAEPVLRDAVRLSDKGALPEWHRGRARSLLGAALVGLGKNGEAEGLLLAGYEMMERDPNAPNWHWVLVDAGQRLVRYYEATGQADLARTWRKQVATDPQAGAPR